MTSGPRDSVFRAARQAKTPVRHGSHSHNVLDRVLALFKLSAEEALMLELRPNCECCNRDLPPESKEARICTYECTFCADCVETRLKGVCPNCGGDFAARPIRPASKLVKDPPSGNRVFKPDGCGAA
jgi:uncharacterized protein